MRVKVAIPISKPIRMGGFIAGSEGDRTWVTFKYERLPIFCHYCGILGHDVRHCAGYFAASKNGGSVKCQYGDWLKLGGTRSWSPPKHGKSQSPVGEEEGKVKQGERSKQQPGMTDIGAKENPTVQETCNNDKSVESATVTELTKVNAENKGVKMGVTEVLGINCGVIKTGISSTTEEEVVLPTDAKHMITYPHDEPIKQKPKWTRIQHMECGPVEENKDTAKSVLGKRGKKRVTQGKKANIPSYPGLAATYPSRPRHPCQARRLRSRHHVQEAPRSTGKAEWIADTTFLILAVPLIIEMDRDQHLTEIELQNASLLGTAPTP
ncbi:mitochondrial import receptor subunit tom9-2 [Quercus suber]|uniref:Mitochondrial import receptor subunit tom9-2 n=1 Tax=Quercus suber TaxID=58331 RepID=A0AAW0LDC7_QUESU